jgi:hypothetical protein
MRRRSTSQPEIAAPKSTPPITPRATLPPLAK